MISDEDLREIESSLLPAVERHRLRLLVHGLRTLQAIRDPGSATTPDRTVIVDWIRQQTMADEDPGFAEVFTEELLKLSSQLSEIAREIDRSPPGASDDRPVRTDPLQLTPQQLKNWACQQTNATPEDPLRTRIPQQAESPE